jgi:hypothetical protein
LSWGAVDASFTRTELLTVIKDGLPSHLDPAEVLDRMIENVLVVETPEGSLRSRMAETVRLLTTLRQTFRNRRWWEAAPLVLDQRFLHRPRRRPERHSAADFRSELAELMSPPAYRVAEKLLPQTLAGFQERATREVLGALQSGADRGVMVTAGTGSGKSLAFYLPALSWIGETIADKPAHGVRCIAAYPRSELLKDQLAALLAQARVLQQARATARPIVIGTWFGATPQSARQVMSGGADGWEEWRTGNRVVGWRCPFLDCPACGNPMIWPATAARAGQEELTCVSAGCATVFNREILNLSRETATRRPADVILTTTESINRQLATPDRHVAFGISGHKVRLVLLDEVHVYEGTTGAQNALLLRRLRHAIGQPVTWVGLSATLLNADRFLEQLAGLPGGTVSVARPEPSEMAESGAEYLIALRHDPAWRTGPLSTTIQTAMLVSRCLDRNPRAARYRQLPSSSGLFGSRTFAFTDKLDVTNRLYWNLLDAEGWQTPTRPAALAPLTLAHLRAEEQLRRPTASRESAADREPVGQWWWLPETLGWDLDGDVQLAIGRTSSQDIGVSEEADVIVATAALEVGYDDERVGAILQHKAPHDAAQFLQRRGRAGRDALMRPWTIVVLSDWGRDRRSWQLYEDLLDPELRTRWLPLGNRYVLRMQAVYVLMDWLGGKLSGRGTNQSAWRDLVAPARMTERTPAQRDDRLARQQAAAALLDEVLAGGLAREQLRSHLRKALKLEQDDGDAILDALLWEPPRPLLLTVIPIIARRLRSQWDGEVPDGDDPRIQTITPLREFVAGNLFDDLLVPEVRITLRRQAGGRAPARLPAQEEAVLPALRTIRELMPGNVTRHFGVQSWNRRHWVVAPQPLAQVQVQIVDLTAAYGAVLTARFADPCETAREILLYRPQLVALDVPPRSVRDATTSSPRWGVRVQALGAGRSAQLTRSQWRNVIARIAFHTHGTGDGVRVQRYATGADGSLFEQHDPIPFSVSFSAPDIPPTAVAALGVEMDVDGVCLSVVVPPDLPEPTSGERSDRLRWLLVDNPVLPAGLSRFDRMSLVLALQLAIAELDHHEKGSDLAGLGDDDLAARLAAALERLGAIRLDEDAHPGNDPAIAGWCSDPVVLETARTAARSTRGVRDQAWEDWARHRFAATVGALFVNAVAAACPDIDTNDLALDVAPRAGDSPQQAKVWLTETAPGGTGQIEQLHVTLAQEPGRFTRILEASAAPGDIEQLDSSIRAFMTLILSDGKAGDAAAQLRRSWTSGHAAVESALANLRAAVSGGGLELSRLAWTTISTRLLGPGARPELPAALISWIRVWDETEARVNLALDPQVISALIADRDDVAPALNLRQDASVQRRSLAVANMFWPRGSAAWLDGADPAATFGSHPDPDIALVREVLGPPGAVVAVTGWDDMTRRHLHDLLLRDARVVLRFPASLAADARQAVVTSQADPIDLGGILSYPDVVAVSQSVGHIDVTFALSEVEA